MAHIIFPLRVMCTKLSDKGARRVLATTSSLLQPDARQTVSLVSSRIEDTVRQKSVLRCENDGGDEDDRGSAANPLINETQISLIQVTHGRRG